MVGGHWGYSPCRFRKENVFYIYPMGNGGKNFMRNFLTSKIEGIGKVVLKMTTGRFFTLKDVRHVPDI